MRDTSLTHRFGRLPAALAALALAASLVLPLSAAAQTASRPQITSSDAPAEATREQFMELLRRFPTGVAQVIRLDPSLLSNEAYLTAYPGLTDFLKQHPEVRRNPEYFLQSVRFGYVAPPSTPGDEIRRVWMDVMTGLFVLALLSLGAGVLGWIVRNFIDYRRWNRLSKLQAEAHAKLLDRFTQNDELMGYIQSPAGTHFLQSMPIMLDPARKTLGAPLSRILWAVQAGVVLAAAGIGLQYVSGQATEPEVIGLVWSTGVVITSVGIGFVIAAAVSFVLSRRFGLFEAPAIGAAPTGRDA